MVSAPHRVLGSDPGAGLVSAPRRARGSDRRFYLDLAARGARMPIGTDLLLQEQRDPEAVLLDGRRLGEVVERAARRYRTPLAIPLMDLRIEKADLLSRLGIAEADVDAFHFDGPPPPGLKDRFAAGTGARFLPRQQAHLDAIRHIATETDLVPLGMCIGPFSLMTKLLADPITPIALAGMGLSAGDEPGILAVERCLELAEAAVVRSVEAQTGHGAQAVIVCEPAANVVYLSPKQIEAGADIFERFVMQPNLRLAARIRSAGAELIFHDCGQLLPGLVREFAVRLHPAMLSLGSSRKLWEDAALVPPDVVLYGNLPTKTFYSDAVMPVEAVRVRTQELLRRMEETAHPHILGSECDVLHVPDAAQAIRRKVDAMLGCDAER